MTLQRRRGFRPDHVSFGRFMLSEQARDPAVRAAEDISTLARARAPKETTDYAQAFDVVPAGTWVAKNGNPRAIALVTNDSAPAAALEFGNKRTKAQHVLRKAGEEAVGPPPGGRL